MTPRVVFDTVVFVRCLLNPYSTWGRLVFRHWQRYRLVLSEPILIEILEVMQRPELTRKFRSLAGFSARDLLDLLSAAETVTLTTIASVSRDPKDDKFLATAVVGGATYLVSEDRDLLDLVEYGGVSIISAAEFLALLENAS